MERVSDWGGPLVMRTCEGSCVRDGRAMSWTGSPEE